MVVFLAIVPFKCPSVTVYLQMSLISATTLWLWPLRILLIATIKLTIAQPHLHTNASAWHHKS